MISKVFSNRGLAKLRWPGARDKLMRAGVRHLCCQKHLPTRQEQLQMLKCCELDVLIIGGGAVGCGCALDAASRGLTTALLEADDFASGASCKSNKLIDGGAAYLQAALQNFDMSQLHMMREMMQERAIMLRIAPHLSRPQPMLVPIYSALQLPLHWLGCKIYDCLAGGSNIKGSHMLSKDQTLNEFPLLCEEALRGGIVYYDAVLNDARMCLALAMTAAQHGACVLNHVELKEVHRIEGCERVAHVHDRLAGDGFCVRAKCIVNATGAMLDNVRQMDDQEAAPISAPSCNTLVSLPNYFCSGNYGLLSPSSNGDEPALLLLPWENHTLLGTMESKCRKLCKHPAAKPGHVELLLEKARRIMSDNVQLSQRHVRSAWAGIQPGVNCPLHAKYQPDEPPIPLSSFLVEVSDDNMISLGGGRWSNYRIMAQQAIDTAIVMCGLEPEMHCCMTHELLLDGAQGWDRLMQVELMQCYDIPMDVAQHLSDTYGSNAHHLLAESTPALRRRLHCNFPYIGAEVHYACKHEYASQVVDVIARRLRVSFVDAVATLHILPRTMFIMSELFDWSEDEQKEQLEKVQKFLCRQMGLGSIVNPNPKPERKPKRKNAHSGCASALLKRMESRNFSAQPLRLGSGKQIAMPTAGPVLCGKELERQRQQDQQVPAAQQQQQLPKPQQQQPQMLPPGGSSNPITAQAKVPPSAEHAHWRNQFTC